MILVLRVTARWASTAAGVVGGGRARGGGWGTVTGACCVLLQEGEAIPNETHDGWYSGRSIQVIVPNLKSFEGIVDDIQVLEGD